MSEWKEVFLDEQDGHPLLRKPPAKGSIRLPGADRPAKAMPTPDIRRVLSSNGRDDLADNSNE